MSDEIDRQINEAVEKSKIAYDKKRSALSIMFGTNETYIDSDKNYTEIDGVRYRIINIDFGAYLYM